MTRTPSLLADLLADCDAHGIRLALADGDGLEIDAPQNALTPDLLGRLKSHKADLLAILRRDPKAHAIDLADAESVWHAALDRLVGDPRFTPELLAALRGSSVAWADSEARDERLAVALEGCGLDPAEVIDPAELVPCPTCARLELWETLAGNWRCLRCDPPTRARRLAEAAERIRRRANRDGNARHNG